MSIWFMDVIYYFLHGIGIYMLFAENIHALQFVQSYVYEK